MRSTRRSSTQGESSQSQSSGRASRTRRSRREVDEEEESSGSEMEVNNTQASQVDVLLAQRFGDDGWVCTQSQVPEAPEQTAQISGLAQSERYAQNLTEQQRGALLSSLVRYILFTGSKNEPIKASKIREEVFKNYSNVWKYFLVEARKYLNEVFGYDLVRPSEAAFGQKFTKNNELWILSNRISHPKHLLFVNGTEQAQTRGLLMIVLSFVWCSAGHKIGELKLWKQLNELDPLIEVPDPSSSRKCIHPELGDVGHLINVEFTQSLYLLKEKSNQPGEDGKSEIQFVFGPRAEIEIGKRQILQFIVEVLGKEVTEAMIRDVEGKLDEDDAATQPTDMDLHP